MDALALGVIAGFMMYQSIKAVWAGDFCRLVRVLEVLAAFVAAIVGAHIVGQHLWAG